MEVKTEGSKKLKTNELSKAKTANYKILKNKEYSDEINYSYYSYITNKYIKCTNKQYDYYQNNKCFALLRNFSTKSYYGQIGCYVIRNRNNGKCCVGQSKNIGKRIEQHFDGTKPINYSIADDYYASNNKENHF